MAPTVRLPLTPIPPSPLTVCLPPPVPPPQVQYNDRSPMENYHIAATWRLLKEDKHNFLKKLPLKVSS